MRSFARPDKKKYREGAKVATGQAIDYAQANCMKYFEFQYTWGDIMARMASDAGLRQALVQAAIARQAGEEIVVEDAVAIEQAAVSASKESLGVNIDPGMTSEIRLDLADDE